MSEASSSDGAPLPSSNLAREQRGAAAAGGSLSKCPAGLPIEAGGVRVSDRGFERLAACEAALVPWEKITCVTAHGPRVAAEGREEDDGPARVLYAFRAGREKAEKIEAAWRERVLRSLARGEPLVGTIRARAAWLPRGLLLLSLLMMASAIADAWVVSRAGADLSPEYGKTGDPFGPPDPPGLARMYRAVRAVAWAFLVVASAGAIALLAVAIRFRRLLGDWRRWELTGDGLAYWPRAAAVRPAHDGSVLSVSKGAAGRGKAAGRGERCLLRPLAGDVFAPGSARMNQHRVPLRWLSGSTLLTPLFLAWGRRAQSTVYRDSLPELLLTPAVAAGFMLLSLVMTAGPTRWSLAPSLPGLALTIAAAGGGLAGVWIVLFIGSGRKRERLVEEGARLLERLGW